MMYIYMSRSTPKLHKNYSAALYLFATNLCYTMLTCHSVQLGEGCYVDIVMSV